MKFNPAQSKIADRSTSASLPGQMQVDPLVCLRDDPVWLRRCGSVALGWIAVIAALCLHKIVAVPIAVAMARITMTNVRRFMKPFRYLQEKAWFGCLNPAKVISVSPYQIAVFTDLSTGGRDTSWPAIKIMRVNFERTPRPRPALGARVPTVAFYQRIPGGDPRHWADFNPSPLQCLTGDMGVIRRQLDRLNQDPDNWEGLDRYLAQVPTPHVPGLYEFGPVRR